VVAWSGLNRGGRAHARWGASADCSRRAMEGAQLMLKQRAARSTAGRRRWRRGGGDGEGRTRERDSALRNACTVLVQVGQNSVCAVQMVGRPM
jgi:hypothetical protein